MDEVIAITDVQSHLNYYFKQFELTEHFLCFKHCCLFTSGSSDIISIHYPMDWARIGFYIYICVCVCVCVCIHATLEIISQMGDHGENGFLFK